MRSARPLLAREGLASAASRVLALKMKSSVTQVCRLCSSPVKIRLVTGAKKSTQTSTEKTYAPGMAGAIEVTTERTAKTSNV